ncbi:hypothetical protein [Paractinoplanes rishiriensis]|nr:hypothetical protein [Actinoplanes rishiriensis]
MTAKRIVLLVTSLVVAALGTFFALARWDTASRVASVASALAGVAAVGVAVWAALPAVGGRGHAVRTGSATAVGRDSHANSGVIDAGNSGSVANRTGNAQAENGGQANTGVDRRP